MFNIIYIWLFKLFKQHPMSLILLLVKISHNFSLLLTYSWLTMLCSFPVYKSDSIIQTYIFFHSFPLQVITKYWIWFSVLYNGFLFVIYFIYSGVYMLIPNSFILSPSRFDNPKFVFYVSRSICFVYKFICVCVCACVCIYIYSTYKWFHDICLTYFT